MSGLLAVYRLQTGRIESRPVGKVFRSLADKHGGRTAETMLNVINKIIWLLLVLSPLLGCSEWLAPSSSQPLAVESMTPDVVEEPTVTGTFDPGPLIGSIADATGSIPAIMGAVWAELRSTPDGPETIVHISNDLVYASRFREIRGFGACAIYEPAAVPETIFDIALTLRKGGLNELGLPKQLRFERTSVEDSGGLLDVQLYGSDLPAQLAGTGTIEFSSLRERNDGDLQASIKLYFPRADLDAWEYEASLQFPAVTVVENPQFPTCPAGQRATPIYK